jgi:hypothetical protein
VRRAVVVLPFVPVTAISEPWWNRTANSGSPKPRRLERRPERNEHWSVGGIPGDTTTTPTAAIRSRSWEPNSTSAPRVSELGCAVSTRGSVAESET